MNRVNSWHILWLCTSSWLQQAWVVRDWNTPLGHEDQGVPTTPHFPCLLLPLPVSGDPWSLTGSCVPELLPSLSPTLNQHLRGSVPGLFGHLGAPAAFDAQETPHNSIRSSLQGACNYVLSGPCNDSPLPLRPAQLPRTFCWEGTNLLSPIGCSSAQRGPEGLSSEPAGRRGRWGAPGGGGSLGAALSSARSPLSGIVLGVVSGRLVSSVLRSWPEPLGVPPALLSGG